MRITRDHLNVQLLAILKANAPARGENIPAGRKMPKNYLRPTKLSPHPGNLRLSGITENRSKDQTNISVGGPRAIYANITEYTSFKKGWMQQSQKDFLDFCRSRGGQISR